MAKAEQLSSYRLGNPSLWVTCSVSGRMASKGGQPALLPPCFHYLIQPQEFESHCMFFCSIHTSSNTDLFPSRHQRFRINQEKAWFGLWVDKQKQPVLTYLGPIFLFVYFSLWSFSEGRWEARTYAWVNRFCMFPVIASVGGGGCDLSREETCGFPWWLSGYKPILICSLLHVLTEESIFGGLFIFIFLFKYDLL